jgi:hypothetical protein
MSSPTGVAILSFSVASSTSFLTGATLTARNSHQGNIQFQKTLIFSLFFFLTWNELEKLSHADRMLYSAVVLYAGLKLILAPMQCFDGANDELYLTFYDILVAFFNLFLKFDNLLKTFDYPFNTTIVIEYVVNFVYEICSSINYSTRS